MTFDELIMLTGAALAKVYYKYYTLSVDSLIQFYMEHATWCLKIGTAQQVLH